MKKLILISFIIYSQMIFADSFNFDHDHITIQTGSVSNLNNLTNMRYRFAYELGGFGHFRSAVELYWTDKGEEKSQMILDGMVTFLPKSVTSDIRNSTIIIRFDNPKELEPEDIFHSDLIYKYNQDKNVFEPEK